MALEIDPVGDLAAAVDRYDGQRFQEPALDAISDRHVAGARRARATADLFDRDTWPDAWRAAQR